MNHQWTLAPVLLLRPVLLDSLSCSPVSLCPMCPGAALGTLLYSTLLYVLYTYPLLWHFAPTDKLPAHLPIPTVVVCCLAICLGNRCPADYSRKPPENFPSWSDQYTKISISHLPSLSPDLHISRSVYLPPVRSRRTVYAYPNPPSLSS